MAQNNHIEADLWQTIISLRGTVAHADCKHCIMPLLFILYLSLLYEQRYRQLQMMLKNQRSLYFTGDPDIDAQTLTDQVEYQSVNVFIIPPEAQWDYLRKQARTDNIKIKLDNAMRRLQESLHRLNQSSPQQRPTVAAVVSQVLCKRRIKGVPCSPSYASS